ncbi:MAG: LAGLIDADG family homing endonuclease [Candidatus Omnitrophota bacterium]
MIKLEISNRVRDIENRFNVPVKDLLYQMHWLEDMKHRDIALMLNTPRVTVTRWFRRLYVPTQSCRRFTDKNLTSWLYKTGKLIKKPKCPKSLREPQANIDFFKKWSPGMAYVLGYFSADGCMFVNPRGSKYVSFSSTDIELLEKVKKLLNSKHKLSRKKIQNEKWNASFVLQIGSKRMFGDLLKLGFIPNKELRLKLPDIPKIYIRHFVRGYFDGDGSIIYGYFKRRARKNKMTRYISTCFACANPDFLKHLSEVLLKHAAVGKGYIDRKGGHLSYSKLDSSKLFRYMYKGVLKEQYLERKHNKFLKAIKFGAVA